MIKQYLETGKIVGTHGIKGELRLQPWTDAPEDLVQIKKLYLDAMGNSVLHVQKARVNGNIVLLKIKGIDTINDAELYRNKVVYLNRTDLKMDKDTYFIQDIIGCTVYDAQSGDVLGKLTDVSKTGANDVWHVTNQSGEYLVPVIDDVVKTVDPAKERIEITPLKGIFDDAD